MARYKVRDYLETTALSVFSLMLVWGIFLGGAAVFSHQKCEYVCTANGDVSAWRLLAGCWCRDSAGLYNPHDTRGRDDD